MFAKAGPSNNSALWPDRYYGRVINDGGRPEGGTPTVLSGKTVNGRKQLRCPKVILIQFKLKLSNNLPLTLKSFYVKNAAKELD